MAGIAVDSSDADAHGPQYVIAGDDWPPDGAAPARGAPKPRGPAGTPRRPPRPPAYDQASTQTQARPAPGKEMRL